MMQAANTKYVIKYDYVLGEDITVPNNCVLQFDGGSISGEHTITGSNTSIEAGLIKIFDTDVTLSGTWNISGLYLEWFGAIGDGATDDTDSIQAAVDNTCWRRNKIQKVLLAPSKTYIMSRSLNLYPFSAIIGSCEERDSDSRRSAIKNTVSDAIITQIKYDGAAPRGNIIKNVDLIGNGDNIAITHSQDATYTCYCTFENVKVSNVKFGYKSGVQTYSNVFDRFKTRESDTVGIGIYIDADNYVWGINIRNSDFSGATIGGIYIKHTKRTTSNIEISNCGFAFIGNAVDIDDYAQYGCFGIYLHCKSNDTSSLNGGTVIIEKCYFESVYPFRTSPNVPFEGNDTYTISTTPAGNKYVSNPNDANTASIVITGHASYTVRIRDCFLATQKQTIAINGACNLSMEDNQFEHPGYAIYKFPDEFFGKSVIKFVTFGDKPSISFKHFENKISSSNIFGIFLSVTPNVIEFPSEVTLERGTFNINAPAFKNITDIFIKGNGHVNMSAMYVGNSKLGIGMRDSPYDRIDRALGFFTDISTRNIIVKENKIVTMAVNPTSCSEGFHLSGEDKNTSIIDTNKKTLKLYNNTFVIENCTITGWEVGDANIALYNANLYLKNVVFDASFDQYAKSRAIINTHGVCNVYVSNCSITPYTQGDQQRLVTLRSGALHTDVVNTNDVVYDGGPANNTSGAASNIPTSGVYEGYMYMINDGANHFPIYAHLNNGTIEWYKADGTQYTG
jgi:hypothetical protein